MHIDSQVATHVVQTMSLASFSLNAYTFLISGCHNKVIPRGCNLMGMEILQIGIHSCASLVFSCMTPFTTFFDNCLPSKLSKKGELQSLFFFLYVNLFCAYLSSVPLVTEG